MNYFDNLFDYKLYNKNSDFMENELTGGMINIHHIQKKYLMEIDKKSELFYELVRKPKIVNVKENEYMFRYIFDELFEMIDDDNMYNKLDHETKELIERFFQSVNNRIKWYEIRTGKNINEQKFMKQFLIFLYIHGFENIPYKIIDIVKILYRNKYDYELLARVYQLSDIENKKNKIMQLKNDGYNYKNIKFLEHVHLNKEDWKEIDGDEITGIEWLGDDDNEHNS